MPINRDFRDLFATLNDARVRYLLVGGYAVAFHTEPRYTKALDVWVEAGPENAPRVLAALRAFGAPIGDLTIEDLERATTVFQMGVPPNRIDIVTGLDAVTFDDAWQARASMTYGDQPVAVIGRDALIANKRAVGRPQDLADLERLERGD